MASNQVRIEVKLDESKATSGIRKLKVGLGEVSSADKALDWRGVREGGAAAQSAQGGFTVLKGVVANLASQGIALMASKAKDAAAAVVEIGSTFETSMSKVSALSSATGGDLAALESKARELGATTTFSASQAADALGYMALAGWDTEQMLGGVGSVLTLAQAGSMDLAAASDLVTDYLSAFNMTADDTTRMVDVLAYAQANANTTVDGLGQAFKNCAANCNAAGMDVETTTAAISMMANQGLKGSEAGTALNAVMRDMTAKMKDGAIEIGNQSVAVMDAQGNYRDFTDILRDVGSATAGMGEAEKAAALQSTFTADSIKGLNLMLNAGADEMAGFRDELYSSAGAGEEMARVMTDNLGGDLAAMGSALEELALKVYDHLQEPLRQAVQFITGEVVPGVEGFLSWLTTGTQEFDEFGNVVGESQSPLQSLLGLLGSLAPAVVAVAAGYAGFRAASAAMAAVTAVQRAWNAVTQAGGIAQLALNAAMRANPIGIVVTLISGLVAALVYLWNTNEGFRQAMTAAWEAIMSVVGPIIEGIGGAIGWVSETVGGAIDFLTGKTDDGTAQMAESAASNLGQMQASAEASMAGMAGGCSAAMSQMGLDAGSGMQQVLSSVSGGWQSCEQSTDASWQSMVDGVGGDLSSIETITGTSMDSLAATVGAGGAACEQATDASWGAMTAGVGADLAAMQSATAANMGSMSATVQANTSAMQGAAARNLGSMQSSASSALGSMQSATAARTGAMAQAMAGAMGQMAGDASSAMSGIGSDVAGGMADASRSVSQEMLAAVRELTSAMRQMNEQTASGIRSMSGAFSAASFRFPRIPMPHFSISGGFSLNPPQVPSFAIDWRARGGVFNAPAVIGIGEAGTEAAVPLRGRHMAPFAQAVADNMPGDSEAAREVRLLRRDLKGIIAAALAGTGVEWNERELGRLVRRLLEDG